MENRESEDLFVSFLRLSEVLTGFSRPELLATGVAGEHWMLLKGCLGPRFLRELLKSSGDALTDTANVEEAEAGITRWLAERDDYGIVAKRITKLWYLGTWFAIPSNSDALAAEAIHNKEHIPSSAAYREGLVWKAMGSHPRGAKPTGFASWTTAPDVLGSRQEE